MKTCYLLFVVSVLGLSSGCVATSGSVSVEKGLNPMSQPSSLQGHLIDDSDLTARIQVNFVTQ